MLLIALCGGTAAAVVSRGDDVKLWRLDCGRMSVRDFAPFSDTHRYDGQSRTLVVSCYLIKHGTDYMLWDAGLDASLAGLKRGRDDGEMTVRLSRTLTSQLAMIGVEPSMVRYVGISHYHDDHTGQASAFPDATLLVGAEDWSAVRAGAPEALPADGLTPWLTGGGNVRAVEGDLDVFGDGSVTMLSTPGHTPGHHSLLVRLQLAGWVLLSGDQFHTAESFRYDQVPSFNDSRAATIASTTRLKEIVGRLRASLVIQHEPGDIGKLPPFPVPAR